jgi:uncharacterized protein YjbI with pentapeptide repeats
MTSSKTDLFAEEFKNLDLSLQEIVGKDFDDCSFEDCNFSNILFKQCRFVGCTFYHCDLSLMRVLDSQFSDISFEDCKIIGVDWTKASWDSLTIRPMKFYKCVLNDSSFWGLQLEEMHIKECEAKEVDFREANLQKADFYATDFEKALFRNSNLTEANFVHARNFDIDIKANKLKGAKFSRYEALRLLGGLEIELVD